MKASARSTDMKIIKGNQKFRFLVHGGKAEVVEVHWSGDLVVIEFPDGVCARSWYASPAYQAILPLRVDNTEGDVVFVDFWRCAVPIDGAYAPMGGMGGTPDSTGNEPGR